MSNVIISSIVSSALLFCLGLLIGSKQVFNSSFLEINIYHVLSLFITAFIGVYLAYFINMKNSRNLRRKEYIVKQCNEIDFYLEQKAIEIYELLKEFSEGNKKKQILLFFKVCSSKIGILKALNKEKNKGIDYVSSICEEYKNIVAGSEWGIKTSFDDSFISKFQKDIESLRSTLQNIVADSLN